jgi:hypothetical protein
MKLERVKVGRVKIPVMLARGLLPIIKYLAPLNKFHRDLSAALFDHDNKNKE